MQHTLQLINEPRNARTFGRELTNIPIDNKIKKECATDQCHQQHDYGCTINPLYEYERDIYNTLIEQEGRHMVKQGFMKNQLDINSKMRAILIDWIIEVHLKFRLLPETLYLTVSIIDHYIEKKTIVRSKLQLVGVTAMMIACKYEEIYSPEINDFVFITDRAYTKEEIAKEEAEILHTLEFSITMPSSLRFLQYYTLMSGNNNTIEFNLTQYILEMALLDEKLTARKPSLMVLAAIYLAMKIVQKDFKWPSSKYSEQEIKECAKELLTQFQHVEKGTLHSLKKKFSTSKLKEVSKIRLELSCCI